MANQRPASETERVEKVAVRGSGRGTRLHDALISFSFLAPAVALVGLLMIVPLVRAGQLSLHDWDGVSNAMPYVGLENYFSLLADPRFHAALMRTAVWFIIHLILAVGGGFVLALMISEVRWGRTVFRTAAFLPYVISLSVVGVIWGQIYNPLSGLLNAILDSVGLHALTHAWLGDPSTALPAVALASSWQAYAFYMVIFLAGLQSLDPAVQEAAMVDGAGWLQRVRFVTIPGLHNTITVVVVLAFIRAFHGFGVVWSTTGGGPGTATELLTVYIWRNAFQSGNVSRAATAGIVLAAIVLAVAGPFNRLRDRSTM